MTRQSNKRGGCGIKGLDRVTREELEKWNWMTALRFQTRGSGHQTDLASLWTKGRGGRGWVSLEEMERHTHHRASLPPPRPISPGASFSFTHPLTQFLFQTYTSTHTFSFTHPHYFSFTQQHTLFLFHTSILFLWHTISLSHIHTHCLSHIHTLYFICVHVHIHTQDNHVTINYAW